MVGYLYVKEKVLDLKLCLAGLQSKVGRWHLPAVFATGMDNTPESGVYWHL